MNTSNCWNPTTYQTALLEPNEVASNLTPAMQSTLGTAGAFCENGDHSPDLVYKDVLNGALGEHTVGFIS